MNRCPREEQNLTKADQIFEVECKACGDEVEFFADDNKKKCPKCGLVLDNPNQ